MSVEKLQALQHGCLIGGLVGAGLVVVGMGRLVGPRFAAACRVVPEAKRDTSPGVWRVNSRAWDLAESAEPARDIGDDLA